MSFDDIGKIKIKGDPDAPPPRCRFETERPDECVVCTESMVNEPEAFRCGHWVHIECVRRQFKPECPICRAELPIQVTGVRPRAEFELYDGSDEEGGGEILGQERVAVLMNFIRADLAERQDFRDAQSAPQNSESYGSNNSEISGAELRLQGRIVRRITRRVNLLRIFASNFQLGSESHAALRESVAEWIEIRRTVNRIGRGFCEADYEAVLRAEQKREDTDHEMFQHLNLGEPVLPDGERVVGGTEAELEAEHVFSVPDDHKHEWLGPVDEGGATLSASDPTSWRRVLEGQAARLVQSVLDGDRTPVEWTESGLAALNDSLDAREEAEEAEISRALGR